MLCWIELDKQRKEWKTEINALYRKTLHEMKERKEKREEKGEIS